MSFYYLPHNVSFCLADGQMVFLDLTRDKYISLDRTNTELVMPLLQSKNQLDIRSETLCMADSLVGQGLLTRDSSKGGKITVLDFNLPVSDLSGVYDQQKISINTGHIIRLFKAALMARFKLSFLPLEKTLNQVRARKQRFYQQQPSRGNYGNYSRNQSSGNTSASNIQELVWIFKRLRPLFFTASNHCLFDGLVLVEFLASYNIYPEWVFAVRMGPFRAHCWIQDQQKIFNDSVANVASYTPILCL